MCVYIFNQSYDSGGLEDFGDERDGAGEESDSHQQSRTAAGAFKPSTRRKRFHVKHAGEEVVVCNTTGRACNAEDGSKIGIDDGNESRRYHHSCGQGVEAERSDFFHRPEDIVSHLTDNV
jgi:hypothetical protein